MTNNSVFITGAASGIGRETARQLHQAGCQLALFDIDKDGLDSLMQELGTERTVGIEGSVASLTEIEQAMQQAHTRFGRIDAVFANAGISDVNPITCMGEPEWLRVIDVNLNGVWRTLKAATPHLLESKGYALVMSSLASSITLPLAAHYTASKGAVLNLAEAYRSEVYGFGIEVGTLHPAFARTPLVERSVYQSKPGMLLKDSSKFFREFPVAMVAEVAKDMILKRKRRATAPKHMIGILWFPRMSNALASLLSFRRDTMQRIVSETIKIRDAENGEKQSAERVLKQDA